MLYILVILFFCDFMDILKVENYDLQNKLPKSSLPLKVDRRGHDVFKDRSPAAGQIEIVYDDPSARNHALVQMLHADLG